MSKCLVTKLKESVSDDSLLKLGEMRIRLNAGQSVRVTPKYISGSAGYEYMSASAINGTTFADGSTFVDGKGNPSGFISNFVISAPSDEAVDVSLSPKYVFDGFEKVGSNMVSITLLSDLSYTRGFYLNVGEIILNGFKITPIMSTTFGSNQMRIIGTLEEIKTILSPEMLPNVKDIRLMMTSEYKLYYEYFSRLTQLTNLELSRGYGVMYGKPKDMLDGMVANGRTSGTLRVHEHEFNGTKVYKFDATFGPSYEGGYQITEVS